MATRHDALLPRLRRFRLLPVVVLAAALLAACGGSTSTPKAGADEPARGGQATQTSEGGQVTVKVTWRGADTGPSFAVVMDTHSVDLDRIDLADRALLRVDGETEVRPLGWDAPKGGHHREGTLTFPSETAGIGPGTRTVELVIRDVAGVPERIFRWSP